MNPASDQGAAEVGDTIAYSYVVTNTGNVDLASVLVNDPSIGSVTCPTPAAPGLAPGASETCTANSTYRVTQSDVDAGSVVDTATTTGTDTQGITSPPSNLSSATVPTVAPSPSVSLAKIGLASGGASNPLFVGETISYSYLVTNTGNVDLASVAVDDPGQGGVTCPTPAAPGLAPGASETCTADGTALVTQGDVDRGSITDTATATGTDTQGHTSPPSGPSTFVVSGTPDPEVVVNKSAQVTPAADQGAAQVGDTIAYSYTVTNVGNVDAGLGGGGRPRSRQRRRAPLRPPPGLAPGSSETCTADNTYTVTQADVDAGSVVDTATATGTDTEGDTSPPSDPSTVTVPAAAPAPAVSLTKTGTVTPSGDQGAAKVGDTIAYSYVVTNTGNVTLASVAVDDPTLGNVTCPTPATPGPGPRRFGDLHRRQLVHRGSSRRGQRERGGHRHRYGHRYPGQPEPTERPLHCHHRHSGARAGGQHRQDSGGDPCGRPARSPAGRHDRL